LKRRRGYRDEEGGYIYFVVATCSAAEENSWTSPLQRNYDCLIPFAGKYMSSESILFPSEIGTQVPWTVDIDPVECLGNLDVGVIRDLSECGHSSKVCDVRDEDFFLGPGD